MFMIRVCLVAVSLSTRIFGLASVCARWVATRSWMLLVGILVADTPSDFYEFRYDVQMTRRVTDISHWE
jgi:hypothetical protein